MATDAPPHDLEERATVVVLLGAFNPRIFQPLWFSSRELLAESDVDPSSVVLTDGFSAFQTSVLNIFCSQDRCQISTAKGTPSPEVVRDLVIGTFSVLNETPIWEIGINHAGHIPPQVRRWDDVVAQLGDPQKSFVLMEGQSLRTVEFHATREDRYEGDRTIQLQPSLQLEGGVWFTLNDHLVIHDPSKHKVVGASEAMTALDDAWSASRAFADDVHARLAPS